MSRRQFKQTIISILQKASLDEIRQDLKPYQDHRLLNPLFSSLCHPDEKVRWHAVCCFGWLVPVITDSDLEAGRIVMRRFLWSLNDESGGIGWGGPEAMAEIMCHSSVLRQEYLHMLISYMQEDGEALFQDGNYLELPLLQRGLLWGIGRLCQDHRQEMLQRKIIPEISAYLESPDQCVIGLAIWCLGLLGLDSQLKERIKSFQRCDEQLTLFFNHQLQNITIAELAQNALCVTGQ